MTSEGSPLSAQVMGVLTSQHTAALSVEHSHRRSMAFNLQLTGSHLFILTLAFVILAETLPGPAASHCPQAQLQADAPGSCNEDPSIALSIEQIYPCLCTNQTFLIATGQGIYTICGCDGLTTFAELVFANCSHNEASPLFNVEDIVSLCDGGQGDCQADKNNSDTGGSGGGIGALGWTVIGVVIAVIGIIGTFGAWWCPYPWRGSRVKMHMGWYA